MTARINVQVPDVDAEEVEVIEVCVKVGDTIELEDALITVETDKASMDIPSTHQGVVKELMVDVGDKVSQGTVIVVLETDSGASVVASEDASAVAPTSTSTIPSNTAELSHQPQQPHQQAAASEAAATSQPSPTSNELGLIEVRVPDIGTPDEVDIIEILVEPGDNINQEDGLITLETDKATMDVPCPAAGEVKELKVATGDKVKQGSLILILEVSHSEEVKVVSPSTTIETKPAPQSSVPPSIPEPAVATSKNTSSSSPTTNAAASQPPVPFHPMARGEAKNNLYTSPSVRRLAREFGVDLTKVKGSGRKQRILKEDVQAYVKYELSRPKATAATHVSGGGGLQVIAPPKVDFSKFGEVEHKPLTRIQKISGPNLHRNWVTVPHVTQFEEADITDVEDFRKQQNTINQKTQSGVKITPLVFIMKALAKTLEAFPVFNASLADDGEHLILKKYIHIGIAVDTPNGLVVPVVHDVDKKGIIELSSELMSISAKARDGKLKAADMQGGCMSISSLGGIGGTAFTPIVNVPEVAILGISKSEIKPKWDGETFQPRLILPLSLSYDHRVIDGALAARFAVHLSNILSDIRKLVL